MVIKREETSPTELTIPVLEVSNNIFVAAYTNKTTIDIAPYSDYIRSFKWEALKYPTKRSLNELTIAIQKNML